MSDSINRSAAIHAVCAFAILRYHASSEDLDAIGAVLNALPSAQPGWISCSERLPEHVGRYLISALDGANRRTTVAPYLPRCKAWTMTGRMTYWKVIAWMPLPEPYREVSE